MFWRKLEVTDTHKWPSLLSGNLMAYQYQILKILINLTFITNGLTLIDAPHRLMKWFDTKVHNCKQRNNLFKEPYVDDYDYPLAYQLSYVMVIFVNCLLFSSVVPIIAPIATLFFSIKYRVDKFNLVNTYFHKYESGGRIRESIQKFMAFNMVLYMLTINSFFSLRFQGLYDEGFGISISIMMLIGYCLCLKYWDTSSVQSFFELIRVKKVKKKEKEEKKDAGWDTVLNNNTLDEKLLNEAFAGSANGSSSDSKRITLSRD